MKCDYGGCDAETGVIDSRAADGGTRIRRRRQCTAGHRFTTYETAEHEAPTVSLGDLQEVRQSLNRALRRARKVSA